MTPETIAKPGTEHAEQAALFAWAALNVRTYPALAWLFAIPNGGSRGDTERSARIVGGRLKAEGVKPGVADVFLPHAAHGVHGLFIEMKRANGGVVSPEQSAFGAEMQRRGYGFAVAYGWQAARDILLSYLTP